MILPEINLPFLDSISSIPLNMHAYLIHFAIVLPIILLLLEIANIIFKRRAIDIINIGLIVLLLISIMGAYITGTVDAQSTLSLGQKDISNAIMEHKTIGIYILLFGIAFIAIFKIIALFAQKSLYSILYIFMIILFIFMIFTESKTGRELVDKYGINVTKVSQMNKIQIDLNETNNKQYLQIVEMNKTIQLMKLRELNATQTIQRLMDKNITKELNTSSKKIEPNNSLSNIIKNIF